MSASMSMSMMSIYCRERFGLPDAWEVYAFEVLGDFKKPDALKCKVDGCVPGVYSKGPREGKKKYGDDNLLSTVIDPKVFELWAQEYSKKTGICLRCDGRGNVFVKWNHITGTEHRTCPACSGTGKRAEVQP